LKECYGCRYGMKTLLCAMGICAALLLGTGKTHADARPQPPAWVYIYSFACSCYNRGIAELQTDPAAAIADFERARDLVQLARTKGGGPAIVPLLQAIGRAENIAKQTKPTVVQTKKAPRVIAQSKKPVPAARLTSIRYH